MATLISLHTISNHNMRRIEDALHPIDGKPADHGELMALAAEAVTYQTSQRRDPINFDTDQKTEKEVIP